MTDLSHGSTDLDPACPAPASPSSPRWWRAVLLGGMAGGMGWGIRGQYGHETGAMVAGLLLATSLVWLLCPGASALAAARAIAWCTVAMGFGGAMTYGQTVGLTHDAPLVGNWAALRWGMLGLAVKGGIWIGFAGAFLGMGLGGVRYTCRQLLAVMLVMLGLFLVGLWIWNTPFDPANRALPTIYFSDDWRWEPDAELRPRREVWGGLLMALAGLVVYSGWIRRDRLAGRLALWAIAGGAIGFPLGQSLQAFHAWNPELLRGGFLASLDPHVNWWNFMETIFGATFGSVLGLGLWIHRGCVSLPEAGRAVELPGLVEWGLCLVHAALLAAGEFLSWRLSDAYLEFSLVLGLIPIVAVTGGRWWPWLVMMPITLLPIAGKTLRELAYREHALAPSLGWIAYVLIPLTLASAALIWADRQAGSNAPARTVLRPLLLLATWTYFGLNFAYFRFPWPWNDWTARTPNAMVFFFCAVGLTVATWLSHRSSLQGTPAGHRAT